MPKEIFDLHYLTIIGVIIIAAGTLIGTVLIHRGNAIRRKVSSKNLQNIIHKQNNEISILKDQNEIQINNSAELKHISEEQKRTLESQNLLINQLSKENKNLSIQTDKLRFPIPGMLYADLTIDIIIGEHPILLDLKRKIDLVTKENRFYSKVTTIRLDQIEEFLKLHNSEVSISNEINFIIDQFSKTEFRLNFYKEEKKFLTCSDVDMYDSFRSNLETLTDEDHKAQLVYLPNEERFSIMYKNYNLKVRNKFPQFSSLYDFENCKVNISFLWDYMYKKEIERGVIGSGTKENMISIIDINRIVLKTQSIMFLKILEIEKMKNQNNRFEGITKELIEWK